MLAGFPVNQSLLVLFVCQMVAVSGTIMIVTLGGIIGSQLAPDPRYATLPPSLLVIGTALSTIPAAMLMRRIGRRYGSAFGLLVAALAALLAARALQLGSFSLLCLATFCYGFNMAFVQQYRFAAAEQVEPLQVGKAVSLVLLGSIGGAFLGRELAVRGQHLSAAGEYVGSMLLLSACLVPAAVLMLLYRPAPATTNAAAAEPARPLREIVLQPVYLIALAASVVGYGVMSLVMTATPLSMHVVDGHSLEHTSGVVRAHVIAMYLPSLFSGWLIARLGLRVMLATGVTLMLATLALGLAGQAVMHYLVTLILLGVAWNFLYVSGTTLLTTTYRTSERFKAQALNDFGVFGVAAASSLLAGTIIHQFGWTALVLTAVPPVALLGFALLRLRASKAALAR